MQKSISNTFIFNAITSVWEEPVGSTTAVRYYTHNVHKKTDINARDLHVYRYYNCTFVSWDLLLIIDSWNKNIQTLYWCSQRPICIHISMCTQYLYVVTYTKIQNDCYLTVLCVLPCIMHFFKKYYFPFTSNYSPGKI